jgi:ABC-type antimicrobial peptide transport system permease subunit
MPLAYIPVAQANEAMLRLVHGWFSPVFVVRGHGTSVMPSALRGALDQVDPLLPFADVQSMADVQAAAIAPQRFLMAVLLTLAATALLLAAIGIHGLIATSVTERTREIGIRIALGATTAQSVRSLAVPGVALAAAGILIGSAGSLAFASLLRSFVWGVTTSDPVTFVGVALLLLAVATASSVIPALRIVGMDPAATLRRD